MKTFIAILFIIIGIAGGLYVGGYFLFIKGIIQIINAFQINPINASKIAWGIVKIILAAPVGGIIAIFGFYIALKQFLTQYVSFSKTT